MGCLGVLLAMIVIGVIGIILLAVFGVLGAVLGLVGALLGGILHGIGAIFSFFLKLILSPLLLICAIGGIIWALCRR